MSAFTFVTLAFFAIIALSEQKPLDAGNQQSSNKENANKTSEMTPKDNTGRTFGLLQPQYTQPRPGFYPQYLSAQQNPQYRNEVLESARTLGHLRPQMYSQYQSAPQAYAMPVAVPVAVPAYEYSAPHAVSEYSHYPSYGYSGYSSYYKNAEEDKARQFIQSSPAENYMSTLNPAVQYSSKYLVDRPVTTGYSNFQGFYQPQMSQHTMQPLMIRNTQVDETVHPRDAAEENLGAYSYPFMQPSQRSDLTIDDKLQMQIPQDYLIRRLQQITPADIAQSSFPHQQQYSRAAEEYQPMQYMPIIPRADANEQIQDPYISQNDQVIIEPISQNSRAAENEMATYPNWQQQMTMGQMQSYYNDMNKAATRVENLAQDFGTQKQSMQQGPSFYRVAGTDHLLVSAENLKMLADELSRYQSNEKAAAEKSDKQDKVDQDAAGAKSSEAKVSATQKSK